MADKQLINKIKQLKQIKPSSKWFVSSRQILIDKLIEQAELKPAVSFFDWFWFKRLQPMVLSAALVLILAGGPILTVKASQASMPGDFLYPVKKITEQVMLKIASKDSKAQMQVDLAYRRVEELNKITIDSYTPEEKTARTKEVISDIKSNLADISATMQNASADKMAGIAQKTKKIEQDLTRAKETISSEVKDQLAEVEKIVAEANNKIMAVLIQIEEDSNNATSTDKTAVSALFAPTTTIELNALETTTEILIKKIEDK